MNDGPIRSFFDNRSVAVSEQLSRRHKADYWILILTSLLLVIGLIVVYSISPGLAASEGVSQNYFITKQAVDIGLALIGFTLAAYLPSRFWLKASVPLLGLALLAGIVVLFTPIDEIYQAHRWIRLGGFSFQVAELIKFALIIWAAGFLTSRWQKGQLNDSSYTLKPLLIALAVIAVLVALLQSDLGSATVMLAILGLMMIVAGMPLKKLMLIAAVVLLAVAVLISSSPYRRERLTTFFSPETNCQDSGYQACQALISVGSGGVLGLGLGHSVQAYGYLPEASDDSIFAIIAEKFGFIGSSLIIIIYGLFITRLKRIIERTSNQFNRLIVVGVLAWLSTQMIINIGAMIGLLPLKGITLPLISQGGTSLVFLTAALGIVFQISRYTSYNVTEPSGKGPQSNYADNSANRRRVRRPHSAPPITRPRS